MAAVLDEFGNPTGEDVENPTDTRRSSVGQWYRQYLGREGSDSEINSWLSNPNFGSVENAIRSSDEANTYRQTSQQAPQTQRPVAPNSAAAWNREQFRDQWMGTGTNVAAQNDLLARYGIQIDGAGRATLPSGELMDLRIGARSGQNLAGWTGVGPTAGPGNGGGGGWNGGSGGASFDSRTEELYQMLLHRATQGLNVDPNDPVIRAQSDAYGANAERARRNFLADTAESAGPLANLQGERRLSAERLGQQTGAFESELVGREMTARRNEIAQALQSMQGLLTTEQSMALQRELAMLNNAIQQQELSLRGQQMSMQNDQFLRQLGFQEADRASYWDALRSGLLGGTAG